MLKEGDLALIINANVTENIGKVVTIVKITNDEIIRVPNGNNTVNATKRTCCIVEGDLILTDMFGLLSISKYGTAPIEWLMPLNDPDQAIETTKELELTH